MKAKYNFKKIRRLFLSIASGVVTAYLFLPRVEIGNHSIIRSFIAPPKLSKYPDGVSWQFEKYLRNVYGLNWEDKTLYSLPRKEVFILVASDFGILNLSLGLLGSVFFGSIVAFLVYKFGFKKPKSIS